MKRARNLNIVQLILNAVILISMGVGIALFKGKFGVDEIKHFAVLSTFVTAFASLLMIVPNIVNIKHNEVRTPKLFFSIRFLSAVMSLTTLIAVLVFICPNAYDGITFKTLFSFTNGNVLFFFAIPLISILMFMFLETGKKERFAATFAPIVCVTIYALGIIIPTLVILSKGNQEAVQKAIDFVPNFFFFITKDMVDLYKDTHKEFTLSVAQCIGFGVIAYLLVYVNSLILFSVNRLTYALSVGQEYKDEATIKKEEKAAQKEKEAKANMTIGEKISNFVKEEISTKPEIQYTQLDHIYHVSYHDRKLKTWKVKSENAGRALKVFKNQKEAIEYAKAQVKLHGGSIRVHSIKGAIRKKGNWDTFDK